MPRASATTRLFPDASARQPGACEAAPVQALLEAQRHALAREIHDDIGGALSALHFDLAQLARHPEAAEAPARLRSAQEALRQAIDATQRVVHALYPPDLDDGLEPALRGLAERFRKRTGLQVAVDGSCGDAVLPVALQLAAYRTLQEALSNVMRHAQCRQVAVALGVTAGVLRVAVRDDGRGFAPEAPDARPAFGLRGLAERARAVGGRLQVDSAVDAGTTVTLTVPLSAAPALQGARP